MDPSIDQPAPSPGEEFKRGFVVMTFSPKFFGGAAEFASTSIHLSNAIKDVYAQYEAERANHRGELPVVSCTGSEAMKDRHGTNYRPIFKIVQWVERPTDLPNRSPVDAADVWRGGNGAVPRAAKAPAQHVPPPAPAPKPAAADTLSEAGVLRAQRRRASALRSCLPSKPAAIAAMSDARDHDGARPGDDAPSRRTSVRGLARRLP